MVRNILILNILLFSFLSVYSQKERTLIPQYITSSIKDSILKSELNKFLKETSFYIENDDKSKIAIVVSVIYLPNEKIPLKAIPIKVPDSNSVLCLISYVNEFYRLTRINSISELDDMLVLFKTIPLTTTIRKEIWINLVKNRFPNEYSYFLNNGEWPLDVNMYHQIPTRYISIKDGHIFDKKTLLE